MNARSLWALSIRTSKEAEEAVAELLARITGLGPTSWTHADSGRTVVTVYSTRKPAAALQTRLRKGLQTIQRFGLNIGEGSVRIRHMRPRDWAESWKAHFKPIAIGTRLLIKPTWDPRKPVHGQTLVLLDPGLSFGTGQH
ncbi:MAG TPA: 50S ribosomal protein L11 methyltransferase, partial [Verrucomicrobiota bacterium]|nr:50S ribosomal protein L11 methyltransferase [Verrucomicrobiota bacterium]